MYFSKGCSENFLRASQLLNEKAEENHRLSWGNHWNALWRHSDAKGLTKKHFFQRFLRFFCQLLMLQVAFKAITIFLHSHIWMSYIYLGKELNLFYQPWESQIKNFLKLQRCRRMSAQISQNPHKIWTCERKTGKTRHYFRVLSQFDKVFPVVHFLRAFFCAHLGATF